MSDPIAALVQHMGSEWGCCWGRTQQPALVSEQWTLSISCSTLCQVPRWEQVTELIHVLMGCSTFPLLWEGVEPVLLPRLKVMWLKAQ